MSFGEMFSKMFDFIICAECEECAEDAVANKLVVRPLSAREKKRLAKISQRKQRIQEKAMQVRLEMDELEIDKKRFYMDIDKTLTREQRQLPVELDEETGMIYVYEPKQS